MTTSADAVSLVLAYLLALLPFVRLAPEQVALLARQVSLALVGAIILGSIRRILLGVARVRLSAGFGGRAVLLTAHWDTQVLRVTSRSLGASLMLLMLAQVMVRPPLPPPRSSRP